jgi:hypothetical protein
MNVIAKLKKDETPSQKLSKHFERIFNTKETFIFDLENQNSTVHLIGWTRSESFRRKKFKCK